MTQKEAAEGMLSPRRAQLLISLGVWHLVAARGLEGERRAVDERVMVMLRACEDGYGAWDVQLAAVIDAFADSAGAEEGE